MNAMMQQQVPIETVHLFPILDEKLIGLLKTLSRDEWDKPTIANLWTVKDIASHLLDGNIRTLSLSRDKHSIRPDQELYAYQDLVGYLNQLNADWIRATKRLSTNVLIELLEITGKQYTKYLATLAPFEDAIFPVAWAGEKVSKNWFHIAREYTEKWHHQQQIRDAVSKQGIMTQELFYPFIDTFMCGLPYTYRNVYANTGTAIKISINTEIGGNWFLVRSEHGWQLNKKTQENIVASVIIDPDLAWRLFTKGITPERALEKVIITGDKALAKTALTLVAVMA